MRRTVLHPILLAFFVGALAAAPAAQPARELRWAGDPEGGAPYVEASPTNPEILVGFDVEIASLAKGAP